MKKGYISWHFSIFWNAFYVFKLGLCFLGFIGFSYPLNILAFLLCGVHFSNSLIERSRAGGSFIISLMLLYHDSYLPGVEQLLAQKENISQFSLSYVLEFIADFVNVRMLLAIPLCYLLLYFISKALRGCTLVFIGMIALFAIEGSNVQQLASAPEDMISSERFLKDRSLDEEGMLTQRGSFTRSNLSAYAKQFYENESQRRVSFSNAQINPFSMVFISADGMSNNDLQVLNMRSHAVLQRFDMRLNNFNAVSISEPELSARLFSSLCGQRHSESFINDEVLNKQCSLPLALAKIGLASTILIDDQNKSEAIKKQAASFGIDERAVLSINSDSSNRTMFDRALELLRSHDPQALFMRFSASANENKAVTLADFLASLNIFLDRLEQANICSLIVLMPGIGNSTSALSLPKYQAIPSDKRSLGTVYFRLSSLPHAHEVYEVSQNVSYLALSEVISRIYSVDPYAEGALISAKALTDELPRTAVVCEDQGTRFMLFRNRGFAVAAGDQDAWVSCEK